MAPWSPAACHLLTAGIKTSTTIPKTDSQALSFSERAETEVGVAGGRSEAHADDERRTLSNDEDCDVTGEHMDSIRVYGAKHVAIDKAPRAGPGGKAASHGPQAHAVVQRAICQEHQAHADQSAAQQDDDYERAWRNSSDMTERAFRKGNRPRPASTACGTLIGSSTAT